MHQQTEQMQEKLYLFFTLVCSPQHDGAAQSQLRYVFSPYHVAVAQRSVRVYGLNLVISDTVNKFHCQWQLILLIVCFLIDVILSPS